MELHVPTRTFAAYIFDCDGTLADTMPLHYRAWKRMVEEEGGQFPAELFYSLGGVPTHLIIEHLNTAQSLRIDVPTAAHRKEEYFVELIAEVRAIEPVLAIARRVHGSVPMAVCSGGYRRYVERTLEAIGIEGIFDAIVCAEDCARGKPHPDPFVEAARRLGVPPGDCLAFEDSPAGVESARAAGMECVFVPSAPLSATSV